MYFRVPVTTVFLSYGRPECNPPPTKAVALGITLVLTAAQRAGCAKRVMCLGFTEGLYLLVSAAVQRGQYSFLLFISMSLGLG